MVSLNMRVSARRAGNSRASATLINNSALRACSKSGILALQTPKFYFAGSKRAQKSGFCGLLTAKIHNLNWLLENGNLAIWAVPTIN
jgi:hypothetical protein